MDADNAEAMLFGDVEYASTNPFPATIGYQSAVLDTLIDTVAVRLRGNTSLFAPKKSFKVDLNAFIPGQKWADLEKLNLNANQNDPSVLRAALSWNILRKMGLAGSRTSMVKVMLNGEYMGVYVNTEHMDEEFVEEYYDKDGGNFYKCLWPATLEYVGPYPDDYKFEVNGRRAYELKTNTEEDDYTDIAEFIDVLNNTPEADFKCAIEEVFNVADFLKVMALDVVSGNWDGYTGNKNNFYLYHNPQTGLFDYIPYDLDNTWVAWSLSRLATRAARAAVKAGNPVPAPTNTTWVFGSRSYNPVWIRDCRSVRTRVSIEQPILKCSSSFLHTPVAALCTASTKVE